jgi:hypothetical protein
MMVPARHCRNTTTDGVRRLPGRVLYRPDRLTVAVGGIAVPHQAGLYHAVAYRATARHLRVWPALHRPARSPPQIDAGSFGTSIEQCQLEHGAPS